MPIESIFQGSLFTSDFLTHSITTLDAWAVADDTIIDDFHNNLIKLYSSFPTSQTPNEARTEDDLIWPILGFLGWNSFMRQQNLTSKGREDVPDGLLFADDETKRRADTFKSEWEKYGAGLALVESKRWLRPLDRGSKKSGEELAPSTQMLRYLRRVDDLTKGNLRWGILTNGGRWRLYYAGARTITEDFFEIDLAAILGIEGHGDGLFALNEHEQRHALKIFYLVFRRVAFLPVGVNKVTFHERAREEGRFYEERVANSLSEIVFNQIYPLLARSIAESAPHAPLDDVRETALVLLYRLLFILYAEDRDLLPVNDRRYDDYGLRQSARLDIGKRKSNGDVFSTTAARYWSILDDLCRAIDKGDKSIGLPPYNGGLFASERTPLLSEIKIGDAIMAEVIDRLSFEQTADGRKYINYRDLSVRQLGSIYERILEYEVVREGELVDIRPNIFARKGSGSYYTPDDLVNLIIQETVEPLIEKHLDKFRQKVKEIAESNEAEDMKLGMLRLYDPAEKLLDLKICDPAMGSGHFLVSLVDYLTIRVMTVIAEVGEMVDWAEYVSPLSDRIMSIRNTIYNNARERDWTVNLEQLDDRHIVRRMVLKRCVYGVDKNPMAVELAKVALWLHSFTVGAPLSFLDHHLRCGNSLFGSWVHEGLAQAEKYGIRLLMQEPIREALKSAKNMQELERLPDAEIAEAHRSADIFSGIKSMTAPLNGLLSFVHSLNWLDLKGKNKQERNNITAALQAFFDGEYGDPFLIAAERILPIQPGYIAPSEPLKGQMSSAAKLELFLSIFEQYRELTREERFFNWQAAFTSLWTDWESHHLNGGFDAVIGNPPWDRMKLQEVEWFAARKREIAMTTRASERKKLINRLEKDGDPLSAAYKKASQHAETASRIARESANYPLLSGGDINLYSLFVERAMALVKPDGMVGLLVPSGIASDLTASKFFKSVATEGRLKALYDFENRRTRFNLEPFFPDVDSRFKFCALIASPSVLSPTAQCAFFLQDVSELSDPEKCFPLAAADFAKVNPNTGTAPIFRSRRDAALTTAIYERFPVLVDRSGGEVRKAWPVKYMRMFDMTNDSHLFRTRTELEEQEGAFPVGQNRFQSASGRWIPLYVGRMIHQFDHRSASVETNEENLHNAALSGMIAPEQKKDPNYLPIPQYWVSEKEVNFPDGLRWTIAFRDIGRATDVRTMISAVIPYAGAGNTAPIITLLDKTQIKLIHNLIASINSIIYDYIIRIKVQSTHLNWYIIEQTPIISPQLFTSIYFGNKSASEIIREATLELTYTAHDLAPFAKDMGYVDAEGKVKPPFVWDDERRLKLRAKLDAVFFHLYGVTDRDDIRYIYSTFPIVERQEIETYGSYRSCELCLDYVNALKAGMPDVEVTR